MKRALFSFLILGATHFSFQAAACDGAKIDHKDAAIETVQGMIMAAGRACTSTSDCLPGENCIHGTCQVAGGGGSCLSDVDCAVGEHCVAGNCRR
jgi:hypothetical protein